MWLFQNIFKKPSFQLKKKNSEAIQGIKSPVERSEDDFDAGAKYHIPASVPYIRSVPFQTVT